MENPKAAFKTILEAAKKLLAAAGNPESICLAYQTVHSAVNTRLMNGVSFETFRNELLFFMKQGTENSADETVQAEYDNLKNSVQRQIYDFVFSELLKISKVTKANKAAERLDELTSFMGNMLDDLKESAVHWLSEETLDCVAKYCHILKSLHLEGGFELWSAYFDLHSKAVEMAETLEEVETVASSENVEDQTAAYHNNGSGKLVDLN